jgi:hypothetical protein
MNENIGATNQDNCIVNTVSIPSVVVNRKTHYKNENLLLQY